MSSDLYRPADRSVQIQSVLYALGVIGFAFGVGIALAAAAFLVAGFLGANPDSPSTLLNVVSAVLQFAGFIAVAVAFVLLRRDYDLIEWRVPTLPDLAWMAAAFAGLLGAVWVIGLVATLLGLESAQNQVIVQGQRDPLLFLYMIPVTILLVAPGEELVFRGIVQGLLGRAFGSVPGILIASLLFGVVHVVALIGTGGSVAVYIAAASVLGLILGAVYEHTKNILVPIVVHGAWNSMIFAVQYAIAVYELPMPS